MGWQWLGGKAWQSIAIAFWWLIQVLELLVWAISELKARVKELILNKSNFTPNSEPYSGKMEQI